MGTAGPRADARAPASVSLRLLRDFELVVDGVAVEVPSSAQRVVAYLALQSRPQQRVAVASSLWIDVAESRASANLRAALWRLDDVRDRVVAARASCLSLAPDVDVDVVAAVREARWLLDARQDPEGRPPVAERCTSELDLLSGDLLPTWDEDWILFERERLRQLRIHAIEALSDALRRTGRHAEAVEAGLAAVDADPLRESAQRVLIEAHLAEGNLADARRQFASFQCLLATELGVEPSPRLRALVGLASGD
jgi:DNA-binding SARP family transcriptional activator